MRNYFTLTRILLKTGLSNMTANMAGTKNKKNKTSAGMIVLWVFVGICLLPYIGLIFGAAVGGYHMMAAVGQEGLIFDLILMAGSMMTLIFGITFVLTFFYMTNDMEKLLPLPLSPWQIIGAKFTVVFVYESVTNLFIIGPAVFGYGITAGWGPLNWMMGVLELVLLPVMPLVYGGLLSIILMRVFHKVANRNFINVLSTILMLVVVFGISSASGSMGAMDTDQMMELLAQGGNSLVGVASGIFPLLSFGSRAAIFGSILDLCVVILGNVLAVLVFLFLGQKLYFSGVVGINEISSKRKAISLRERRKMVKGRSVFSACIEKEWKLLVRTPVYFLNCALFPLLWPLFICIPVVIGMFTSGSAQEMGQLASQLSGEMVRQVLEMPVTAKITMLVVFGITAFMSSMGFVSGTSISREGAGFVFMKYIPVPYRTQLMAKLSVGMILSVISTTGYFALILIGMAAFGFSPIAAVLALIMTFFINSIINLVELGMDLASPKLNWENEQMAVKQNMNTLFEMLVCVLILGIIGVLYGVALMVLNLNLYLVTIGVIVVLAAVSAGLYVLVMNYGEKRLAGLE